MSLTKNSVIASRGRRQKNSGSASNVYTPVATTMFSSGTWSAIRLIRGMFRPWPMAVTSTIVEMPFAGSSLRRRTASATRSSSSPHSSG